MRHSRSGSCSLTVGAALGASVLFGSGIAGAQEWHLGARAGVATLVHANPGPALDLHGAYGLSDYFDVLVDVIGSHHGGAEDTNVLSADAGIAYKVDVFQWIPYVGILGGYYRYAGASGPNGRPSSNVGAAATFGIDYLARRDFAIGAALTLHASFVDGLSTPYFTAVAGAEYRWGF